MVRIPEEKQETNTVPVGSKDHIRYVTACLYTLAREDNVKMMARGNNVKKAIDVLAMLTREYLEKPTYSIEVGSEKFEERFVSTIEITIAGKKKEK